MAAWNCKSNISLADIPSTPSSQTLPLHTDGSLDQSLFTALHGRAEGAQLLSTDQTQVKGRRVDTSQKDRKGHAQVPGTPVLGHHHPRLHRGPFSQKCSPRHQFNARNPLRPESTPEKRREASLGAVPGLAAPYKVWGFLTTLSYQTFLPRWRQTESSENVWEQVGPRKGHVRDNWGNRKGSRRDSMVWCLSCSRRTQVSHGPSKASAIPAVPALWPRGIWTHRSSESCRAVPTSPWLCRE